jgi:hypothetical protein
MSMGFAEGEARMAITRCGMSQHWSQNKWRLFLMFMWLNLFCLFVLILLREGCGYIYVSWFDLQFRVYWGWLPWELCKPWGSLWLNCSSDSHRHVL